MVFYPHLDKLDLNNHLNWERVDYGLVNQTPAYGNRVPPLPFTVGSPVVLVGIACDDVPDYYYRGGWCSFIPNYQFHYIGEFKRGIVFNNVPLKLNATTLVSIPKVQPTPYNLEITFDKWLPYARVEVSEFVGDFPEDNP